MLCQSYMLRLPQNTLYFLFQLQAQSERLVKINIELRRKNQTHRKHARTLITERVDLETQLAEKEQQVTKVIGLLLKTLFYIPNSCASGSVVDALASHHCSLGSISGFDIQYSLWFTK